MLEENFLEVYDKFKLEFSAGYLSLFGSVRAR